MASTQAGPGGESPRPGPLIGPAPWQPGTPPPCHLIDDAYINLGSIGQVAPDEEVEPAAWAELVELATNCRDCARSPLSLAYHWMEDRQAEWERGVPVWTCDCGAAYKVVPEYGDEVFYQAGDDGLLGDHVGHVRRDSKGRVKDSDTCPGCKKPFAETAARQSRSPTQLAPPEKTKAEKPVQDALF